MSQGDNEVNGEKCFNGELYPTCVGKTIPYTDAGFQKFVNDAIDVATSAINIGFQMMGSSLTENMLKGLNAIRCAIVSGGNSIWYFIAAGWWTLRFVSQEQLLQDLLDQGYPYICTCKKDVNFYAAFLGGSADTAAAFSSCSEAASNVK